MLRDCWKASGVAKLALDPVDQCRGNTLVMGLPTGFVPLNAGKAGTNGPDAKGIETGSRDGCGSRQMGLLPRDSQ